MKKIILTIFISALYITAQSQVTFKPGVRLGLNITKITNYDDGNRIGINAGIFGELKLGSKYALQPELNYSQQGSENIDLKYIHIAVINKFYILNEDTPLYVAIGPSIGFRTNDHTETYNGTYTRGSDSILFEGDISLVGGIGYDFPFGLGIEARYMQGLIDVGDFGINNKNRLNSVIQIGAIYKFDFSR